MHQIICAFCPRAQEENMITSEMKQKIDKLFQLWKDNPGAGGQLVIKYKGDVWETCYGYADIENQIPMTQDTVFNVASVTKQIVAMCIVMLHERGLLHMDDAVSKYLPEMMNYPQKITVSNLLHHTSGLREQYDLWRMHRKEEGETVSFANFYKMFARQRGLNFEPGDGFSYCNTGYTMLVEIANRVTGKPLHDFAKENIFDPLGMTSTHFVPCPEAENPRLSKSYADDGWEYYPIGGASYAYGSGGLRSTCRDMAKYITQYVNPTLISKETLQNIFLHIPPLKDGTVTNYACGVRINELAGHKYIHHGGVTAGFRTVTAIYPEDDLVITAYTNTYNIPIEVAGRDIARIILGLPERTLKNLDEYKTGPVDPQSTAGYYVRESTGNDDFDTHCYDIRCEDGKVCVYVGGDLVPLKNVGGNLYKMGRRDITFAFGDKPAILKEGALVALHKLERMTDPQKIDPILGTYYSEEVDGYVTVKTVEGAPVACVNDGMANDLYMREEDLFSFGSMSSPNKLRFVRDETGKVVGLQYMLPQVRCMDYKKQN